MLKRGLNNNIKTVAKDFGGKNMEEGDLMTIYKIITGESPSKLEKAQLTKIFIHMDIDKDEMITLKDLIIYLNKEYGTFQFKDNEG